MSRYDDPPPQFGKTYAGVYVHTHEQAILLQEVLQREMRERAGNPAERLLARWYNELENIRRRAVKEKWRGWEKNTHG